MLLAAVLLLHLLAGQARRECFVLLFLCSRLVAALYWTVAGRCLLQLTLWLPRCFDVIFLCNGDPLGQVPTMARPGAEYSEPAMLHIASMRTQTCPTPITAFNSGADTHGPRHTPTSAHHSNT